MFTPLRHAVKVAASRRDELELPGKLAKARFFLRAMVGMEDFHRIQALGGQAADQSLGIAIPDGVGERGNAAGRPYRRDDLHRRPLLRPDIPGVLPLQELIEGLLLCRGVARLDQGTRKMGPPPHTVAHIRADRLQIERVTCRDEPCYA